VAQSPAATATARPQTRQLALQLHRYAVLILFATIAPSSSASEHRRRVRLTRRWGHSPSAPSDDDHQYRASLVLLSGHQAVRCSSRQQTVSQTVSQCQSVGRSDHTRRLSSVPYSSRPERQRNTGSSDTIRNQLKNPSQMVTAGSFSGSKGPSTSQLPAS
jgi:hypothetical protein